ncbi:hypothetical protein V6N13_045108 [Hibiscus sabdariffa]|uniref:RIN4 pathogenic type III effector avirulence factor Avr cleavage site domain-containing protein n=1 Tax=Hibiscus sabdariffa TaxID=183260 RepID=A0ABR2RK44_9ROSI
MDDYYRRNRVPAFGSWDWNNDLPFTQCFESARQTGLLRYSYSEDRDLYVAGNLYENDVATPAMIVVPRKRTKVQGKKQRWEASHVKQAAAAAAAAEASPIPMAKPTPKPVDEDLYKISPDLLYARTKKAGSTPPLIFELEKLQQSPMPTVMKNPPNEGDELMKAEKHAMEMNKPNQVWKPRNIPAHAPQRATTVHVHRATCCSG